MTGSSSFVRPAVLGLALALTLRPGAVRAASSAPESYLIQSIYREGDKIGDPGIKTGAGLLSIGALNDRGQLVFVTATADGESALFLSAGGKFTPIAIAGGEAPGGKWPKGFSIEFWNSMNQAGSFIFDASRTGNSADGDNFLWDAATQKVTPLVLPGIPTGDSLTFVNGGGWARPGISNSDEIVFMANARNGSGPVLHGVFLLGRDGNSLPVAVPGQPLPDGSMVTELNMPAINDAGIVAFLVGPTANYPNLTGAYMWEQGVITLLAAAGMDAPDGGKFASITGVWLNNQNPTALFSARFQAGLHAPDSLYRYSAGTLSPLVVLGQGMPGGGTFKTLQWFGHGVSAANAAGQHAFLATLDDGSGAAYLLGPDGTLSLLLKSGSTTDLGKITRVGSRYTDDFSTGVGLNDQGQVALPVRINGGKDSIVLLTPNKP